MKTTTKYFRIHLHLLITLTVLFAFAFNASTSAEQSDSPSDRPAATPISENVSLQPTFTDGKTSRFEIWSRRKRVMTVTAVGRSRSNETIFETAGEVTWKVDQVNDDGSAVCTMTLDWMKVTVTLGENPPQVNDSRQDSGDNESLHKMLKAMMGVPLLVTMSPDGSVTKVDGVDEMQAAAGKELPMPDELDFIETASDLAAITAAGKELSIDDTWQTQAAWNYSLYLGEAEAKLQHDTTFTVASIENIAGINVATVNGESKLKLDVDANSLPKEGPQIDINLKKGNATTQIMFDLSRNEAVGRNSTQHTIIDATISFQGRSITQSIDDSTQSQSIRISEE